MTDSGFDLMHKDDAASSIPLHRLIAAPGVKTIAEVLPAFSGVKREIYLGTPNTACACCRKPFTAVRQARKEIRLCPVDTPAPLLYSYRICGRCYALYQRGGDERESFLAAIDAFHFGDDAGQQHG